MARLRRTVGIRSAQVRLPQSVNVGQAIIRTASGLAEQEFAKQADIRQQEARVAAAAIDFERDGDGNLLPPSLPIGENGLLAPSIYDREYTNMVSQRYLQQIKIDTNERLNLIATENRFDPTAYREIAEGYVSKVTELAPDLLKPDVNNTAQVTMVEHFNMITRQKAERDHDEARGVHLHTIEGANNELMQYVEAGASADIIGAKMLEVRALIEQGDAYNYWLDDEKMSMLDAIDKSYALAAVVSQINNVRDDPLAYAEAIENMTKMSQGIGKIEMVDEAGNVAPVDVSEVFPDSNDREKIVDHAIGLLTQRATSFDKLQDERLNRKWKAFYNQYSQMSMASVTGGPPIDTNWLQREYEKAHADVVNLDLDDALREEIRRLMFLEVNKGGPSMPQAEQDFLSGYGPWAERMEQEITERLGGRRKEDLTPDELSEIYFGAWTTVGNVPGGATQTAPAKRFIGKYYMPLTGREETQEFYEAAIADPNHENWDRLESDIRLMGLMGIWSEAAVNALVGKLNAPESFNNETLENSLRLARMFYDQPTFKNNMRDSNALGPAVGGMLTHLFSFGGKRDPATISQMLENYSNPNYQPKANFYAMETEEQDKFKDAAQRRINKYFTSSLRTGWVRSGVQAQGWDLNPLDDEVSIPASVNAAAMENIMANSGFIDPHNPESFDPFIARSVAQAMNDHGFAPTKMGYSEVRHGNQWNTSFNPFTWNPLRGLKKPEYGVVPFPPEYFIARMSEHGTVDQHLVNMVRDDFQYALDVFGEKMGEKFVVDKNAALVYAGRASDWFGEPTWHVKLLRTDGSTSWLTVDGTEQGDLFRFSMEDAVKRRKAQKDKERRRNQELNAIARERVQSGNVGAMARYGFYVPDSEKSN